MTRPTSNVRYEVLSAEEQNVSAEPVAVAMVIPPPAYSDSDSVSLNGAGEAAGFGSGKLPNYLEATTLPTYEEAERSKAQEESSRAGSPDPASLLDFEGGRASAYDGLSEAAIGTDVLFICTFLISFLFNWLGFLVSLCLSNTVASRCGAMSGLGLSIVKWVIIAKHNKWESHLTEADSWLWWLLSVCGFLLFVRGSLQYIRVKYEWARLRRQMNHLWLF